MRQHNGRERPAASRKRSARRSQQGPLAPFFVAAGWSLDTTVDLLFVGWAELKWLLMLFFIAMFAPNTQDAMRNYTPTLTASEPVPPATTRTVLPWCPNLAWSPNLPWSIATAVMLILSLPHLFVECPFLYFQF